MSGKSVGTADLKISIGEGPESGHQRFHNSVSGMILKFVEKILSLTIPSEWRMIFSTTHLTSHEQRGKTSDWSIFVGKPPMINQ